MCEYNWLLVLAKRHQTKLNQRIFFSLDNKGCVWRMQSFIREIFPAEDFLMNVRIHTEFGQFQLTKIFIRFNRLTFIFLLQYFGLFGVIESLISILSSVAPDRRRKFDVIFCANDGLRLLASLLHSFKMVLESWSTWLLRVSSSFSENGESGNESAIKVKLIFVWKGENVRSFQLKNGPTFFLFFVQFTYHFKLKKQNEKWKKSTNVNVCDSHIDYVSHAI